MPRGWQDFLHIEENEIELFHLLLHHLIPTHVACNRHYYCNRWSRMLCLLTVELSLDFDQCAHRDADTRMLLHVAQCTCHKNRFKKGMIRTMDTDFVVIAISLISQLSLDELWVALYSLRYIPAHGIALSLSFFHSFAECDFFSSFAGHGKIVLAINRIHFQTLLKLIDSYLHNLLI